MTDVKQVDLDVLAADAECYREAGHALSEAYGKLSFKDLELHRRAEGYWAQAKALDAKWTSLYNRELSAES